MSFRTPLDGVRNHYPIQKVIPNPEGVREFFLMLRERFLSRFAPSK